MKRRRRKKIYIVPVIQYRLLLSVSGKLRISITNNKCSSNSSTCHSSAKYGWLNVSVRTIITFISNVSLFMQSWAFKIFFYWTLLLFLKSFFFVASAWCNSLYYIVTVYVVLFLDFIYVLLWTNIIKFKRISCISLDLSFDSKYIYLNVTSYFDWLFLSLNWANSCVENI
jgi:hypothetical protein